MKSTLPRIALPIFVASIAACGGGGGGGGSTIREVPFTSFSAVRPNETVVMAGIAQPASGTLTLFGGGGFSVDTANLGAVENATAKLTYDRSTNLSALSFASPQASASFRNVTCGGGVCSAETASSVVVAMDARALGWDYQSFGVWLNQTSPTTFQAASISAGAVTPASAVPTGGPFTFSGFATGFYVNGNGVSFATAADMTAVLNMGTPRSIAFTTSNTQISSLNSAGTPILDHSLNLSGSLIYDAGSNRFSGVVAAQQMTGSATGQFYGPAAEEIGGVYGLHSTNQVLDPQNRSRMIGSFGGKRTP
jgi:C-lobe and N-lobe beta barrels of Tf-binding protein B